ncbi:hypothetical protein CVD23_10015 [Bacillus sp. V33-4]|nr:hypothetical protein CVD23_10015 [Bacillus sp. V33-4]
MENKCNKQSVSKEDHQLLVKWIRAEVPDDKREQFSEAQEQWAELRNLQGFLGQCGGWNQRNPSEACVIGFWKDYQVIPLPYSGINKIKKQIHFETWCKKSSNEHTRLVTEGGFSNESKRNGK